MAKQRKDSKGRVLRRGEIYLKKKRLYCFSYTDPFGKRRYLYAKDIVKLREKEKYLERCKLDGIEMYVEGRATVNYVFNRFISLKTELRNQTRSNYLERYETYVKDGFGRKRISEVRYSDVLGFYQALLLRGLSYNTVKSIHSILFATFQLAVKDRVILYNPAESAISEISRSNRGRTEPRHALLIEEQKAFLAFLDRPENIRWKPIFVVLFGTGCRIGEIIGLRWSDVDFENSSISINHSITYCAGRRMIGNSHYEVNLPKTNAGIRTIPMLAEVREALIAEKNFQKQSGTHSIEEVDGLSGFIFCNRFGGLYNASSLNRIIHRLTDDYNAQEELASAREKRDPLFLPSFSCHIIRHTFCTRLCENETNLKVIQSVMGHKDIQTTMDIYAEVSERKKQEVFQNLNNKVF